MEYEGIKLEMPAGDVSFSHSHAMDMIMDKSGDQNTKWLDALAQVPWGPVHDSYKEHFDHASKIFSLVSMDYQVCNGGIDQYFFNGYHEEREPFTDNDVERVGIEVQKGFLHDVLSFAKEVFPERVEENSALEQFYDAFDELRYEEDAIVMETVYCDEDEYIWDEDLEEDVPNPHYFEPYDEPTYENVIHGEEGFGILFENATDYVEELLELQAQVCCKKLALEVMQDKNRDPELVDQLKNVLPKSAFAKPSLNDKIQSASNRQAANSGEKAVPKMMPMPGTTSPDWGEKHWGSER